MQVIYNFTIGDFYGVNNDCSQTTLNNLAFQASIVVRNPSLVGIVPGTTAVYVMGDGFFDVPIVNSSNPNQTSERCMLFPVCGCVIMCFQCKLS